MVSLTNFLEQVPCNQMDTEDSKETEASTCATEQGASSEKYVVPDNKNDNNMNTNKILVTSGLKSNYLKDLVLLQLNLIEEQQRKIMQKDKEFLALKQERDQLEARVKRMERRIAIQKSRNSLDGDEISRLKSPINRSTPQQKKDSSKVVEKPKIVQAAPLTISSATDKEFQFHKQLKTNTEFLDDPDISLCLRSFTSEAKPSEEIVSVPSYTTLAASKMSHNKKDEIKSENADEMVEDICDDAYLKRHSKPEQEEKRRKRWDLQLLRNQRQQEILIQKYQHRQGGNSSSEPSKQPTKSTTPYFTETLFKEASMAMAIEIGDELPVCAFGYHLPAVKERDFTLPWFSIQKREVQLREAKQRMMKKNSRRKSGI